jgi:hypothetical protein
MLAARAFVAEPSHVVLAFYMDTVIALCHVMLTVHLSFPQ